MRLFEKKRESSENRDKKKPILPQRKRENVLTAERKVISPGNTGQPKLIPQSPKSKKKKRERKRKKNLSNDK
jgi:hypothetical protein